MEKLFFSDLKIRKGQNKKKLWSEEESYGGAGGNYT